MSAGLLKRFGAATAAILKTIMAPQIGREDMCDAIGYIENAGTPVGALVPDFVGQKCFDTTNKVWYIAFAAAVNTDWSPMSLDELSLAELQVLDAVVPGTIAASKAVVVDANKDIGDFRNLDAVNIDAGASGTAGSVDVFPATAAKGKLAITVADQTGNTTVTVNANAMGQATQINIADPGAAASYVAQSTAALTLAEADVLDGAVAGTPAASKVAVFNSGVGLGAFRETGRNLRKQAAPAAKTTSTTLTAAEIMAGLITGNQAAGGGATYTLPLASDLETALLAAHPGLANDDSFDFHVINLSVVAAEDITIATNTGWTLVGSMLVIEEAAGNPAGSNGHFLARRTGANAYTLYRIG